VVLRRSLAVVAEEPVPFNFSQPPTFQSNPNENENGIAIQSGVIGDYHDVFMSGEYGRFQNVWIGRPASDYNIFNYGLWY